MNNKVLWGVGAAVVVVAGVGVWMYGSAGTASAPTTGTPAAQQEQTAPQTQTQPQSLKSLISYQGSQKCTFDNTTATSQSSGTVYVASGQMRGDFTSTSAGKTVQSHMIVRGSTSYVWGDSMPGGFKMSFDTTSTAGQSAPGAVNPNATTNYSCGAWVADASMFALPTTIQFQDLSSMQVPAH